MHVEGYAIKQELGKGGMATVYLAVQESFDREVALKVMAPALVADSTFAARFLREARIVAHLAHPNIVSVYDVGVSDHNYFLAMELHTGGDLSTRLREGVGETEALRIVRQMASALDYAHTNGYVHRDIKPGNVLFSQHGHAVLTDFGIAKAADASTQLTQVQRVVGDNQMTKEGAIVGTPSYMSPEQARGQPVDGRADIYSLGIMLYEMIAGGVPYEASDQIAVAIMHINEPVPVLPERSAHLQPLIDRLCAKDPNDRFQTGAELIHALDEIEEAPAEPEQPSNEDLQTIVISRDQASYAASAGGVDARLKWGAVAAGVLVAAGLGLYALTGGPREEPAPTPTEPAGIEVARSGPTDAQADSDLSPTLRNRIATLLAEAEVAIEANRLSSPLGDNALERYATVLELDPGNREAAEGKVRVADRYISMAKSQVRTKNLASARRYVDKVTEFAPAHPELAQTELLVSRAEARVKAGPTAGIRNEARIAGLLGSARIAFENDQLTSPAGKSAYDKYQAVLKIDANHPKALDGVQRIASRYIDMAARSVAKGDIAAADGYLAKATRIAPSHPKLAAANKKAREAR